MKLIKQWSDTKQKVENYIYENKDKLSVYHTINPLALDTTIAVTTKAGAYFEKGLDVPNGTAHFLEHMLFKPNKLFKNGTEIDKFEFGTRKRPAISINATTNFKYITIYGYTNSQREEDLFKRIYSCIDFPLDNFKKYIEKERKIILAELQRSKRPEKNAELQFNRFALSNKVYTSGFSTIGEFAENIQKITTEDLAKYYESTFGIENTIISIQSPKNLNPKMIQYIDLISKRLKKNNYVKNQIQPETIVNTRNIGYFANTEKNGIKTRVYFFKKSSWREYASYELEVTRIFSEYFIHFAIFKLMREKKGYIYGSEPYLASIWELYISGIEITTDINNLDKAISMLFEILRSGAIKYLHTTHGKRWLESAVSNYIFPNTQSYDDSYAESQAVLFLEKFQPFEYDKAKKAVEGITAEKIEKYIKENFSDMKYGVWIDSSEDLEIVKKKLKKVKELSKYV